MNQVEQKDPGAENWQTKITVSEVRKEYKLKDADIAHLKCELRGNPYYRNGPPMRLYLLSDIQKVAAKKELKLAAERENATDEARKAHAEACKNRMDGWKHRVGSAPQYHSGTVLPLEVLEKILKYLCNDLEPLGVRAWSVIARDIMNASMACKELYTASWAAFQHLGKLCSHIVYSADEEELLDQFVNDPDSLRLEQVKALGKGRSVKLSQPKPVLIFGILQSLGLKSPSRVPAKLLKAIKMEKDRDQTAFCLNCRKIIAFREEESTEFSLRKACMEVGLPTAMHLKAVTDIIDAAAKARADADKAQLAFLQKQKQEAYMKKRKELQEKAAKKYRDRMAAHKQTVAQS